jgi:mono/diheme cytochrome c family protein
VKSLLVCKVLRPLLLVGPLLLAVALLPGCAETEGYSDQFQFKVRTDPILLAEPAVSPQREHRPDQPGKLPLASMAQLPNLLELVSDDSARNIDNTLLDPTKLGEKHHAQLQRGLENLFGTPAQPRFDVRGAESAGKALKLERDVLEEGSRLYRVHCQQCHGLTGDGRGPTAQWVNPHPRDYREGLFKFQSVNQTAVTPRKPARADLYRVLYNGVEGTAMPSFNLLAEHELQALVSYVILLSIRGESELITFKDGMEAHPETGRLTPKGQSLGAYLTEAAATVAKRWEDSQNELIEAVPYPKYSDQEMKTSVQRGHALFLADMDGIKELFPELAKDQDKLNKLKAASCVSCHKDYGREAPFKFDKWGTMTRPANLTLGVYRGGRRPIDLYWRIHSGINGSPMNIFGDILTGEQIWDLVNFVQALPYPEMRKKYELRIR